MASALESKPWTPRTEVFLSCSKLQLNLRMVMQGLGSHMGDCQDYGPFLGPYYNTGPNLGDPRRDHYFDNPPCPKLLATRKHLG